MKFGILKEMKEGENRVICTPREVKIITEHNHEVYIQKDSGKNAGFSYYRYKTYKTLLPAV